MKRSIGAAMAVTSAWLGWRALRTPPPRPTPTPLSRTRGDEEEAAATTPAARTAHRTALRAAAEPEAAPAEPEAARVEPQKSIDGSEIAPLDQRVRLSLAGPALEERLRRLDVFREGLMREGAPPPQWFEDEFRSLEARYFTSSPSMEE